MCGLTWLLLGFLQAVPRVFPFVGKCSQWSEKETPFTGDSEVALVVSPPQDWGSSPIMPSAWEEPLI